MKNNQDEINKLFRSTGCLREEAIELYLSKSIGKAEKFAIEEHLANCEMCSAAIEGYELLLKEMPAEKISVLVSELKAQISSKSAVQQGKNYFRPLLALAAMFIVLIASFILFKMLYKDAEPVLAKLSEPKQIVETDTPVGKNQVELKKVLKPEVQSDVRITKVEEIKVVQGQGSAELEKTVIVNSNSNTRSPQNKELAAKLNEAPQKKSEVKDEAPAFSAESKSTSIDVAQDAAIESTPKRDVVRQDSYYLTPQFAYTVNQSAAPNNTYYSGTTSKTLYKASKSPTITYVVANPEFPGGQDSMIRFIKSNLEYPKKAADLKIHGSVVVSFYVEKDGRLTGIAVKKSLGYGCDEEALRIVKIMPKWIPSKQGRVEMLVPIQFKK